MKTNWIKTAVGMVPADDESKKVFDRLALGHVSRGEFTQPRNPRFNNKFWAMIKVAFDNQDHYKTKDAMVIDLKLACGIYEQYESHNGRTRYIPGSISFAKMKEDEFEQFYNNALDILCKWFGADKDTLEQIVEFGY